MRASLVVVSLVFLYYLQVGCGQDDAQVAKRYTVNLDVEPEKRWVHVANDYTAFIPGLKDALLSVISCVY